MFVAKTTTAITKASANMFDIRDKDGTLRGGSLERDKKEKVGLLDKPSLFSIIKKWIIR